MKFKFLFTPFFLAFIFLKCNSFTVSQDDVVARVGNNYFYRSDLESSLEKSLSMQDSLVKTNSIINDWARGILLQERSLVNLSETKIASLEQLVEEYRIDVFSNAYKAFVIKASLDTIVSDEEVLSFFDSNKSIFRLNQPLYQIRYIKIPFDNVDRSTIKKRFRLFSEDDRKFLDSLTYQFSSYFLNEKAWISKSELFNKLPFLNNDNLKQYIKKSQFFEVKDSLGLYLLQVQDFIERNEIAPIEHIQPTIQNIILNKRKREFLNQFNTEILQDAIKTKKLEIY